MSILSQFGSSSGILALYLWLQAATNQGTPEHLSQCACLNLAHTAAQLAIGPPIDSTSLVIWGSPRIASHRLSDKSFELSHLSGTPSAT